MNRQLAELRKKFKGQKVNLELNTYDNSPLKEGRHVCRVMECAAKTFAKTGRMQHYIRLKVIQGDDKGKSLFPFKPFLDEPRGIVSAARNIMAVLGDVVTADKLPDGTLDIDPAAFLGEVEQLSADMVDQIVEVNVKNQPEKSDGSHLKSDNTPWQNCYIERGLGDDAKGVAAAAKQEAGTKEYNEDDDLPMGPAPAKRKAVKKKVAKKKAPAKKKAVKRKATKKKARR